MGLAETTLVFVSLGFFASAVAHNCQNGTRPVSEENREGCDYYCWNAETKSWDKFFFGNGERCFILYLRTPTIPSCCRAMPGIASPCLQVCTCLKSWAVHCIRSTGLRPAGIIKNPAWIKMFTISYFDSNLSVS
uniref:Putative btsp n=1 Tax=Ixodes ricinus TaxID=34613 RepID=A0A147BXX5_IXORI